MSKPGLIVLMRCLAASACMVAFNGCRTRAVPFTEKAVLTSLSQLFKLCNTVGVKESLGEQEVSKQREGSCSS